MKNQIVIRKIFLLCLCMYITQFYVLSDRLCGLVVRILGYRSGGSGSIPGTNRKKKKFSGSGTGCTQPREYKLRSYLIEK
jgi:hypothetical protein